MTGGVILWDKDSTLADTLHRGYMVARIATGELTWTDYSMAAADDGIIEGPVRLLRLLRNAGWRNIIVSGANTEAELPIRKWATRHSVHFDGLVLRATGNHQGNGPYKVAVIAELRAMGLEPVLYVEDWAEVATQIREETGVPVLVVNPCYPPEATAEVKELGYPGT